MTIPADAQETIERCIMEDEGGWVYTDRADDAGGPTYGGMTWRKFDEWQQRVTKEPAAIISRNDFIRWAKSHPDAKKVLQNRILQCYYAEFWLKGNVSYVPQFAKQMYFSACVNMGLKEALKCLQMACNDCIAGHMENMLLVDGHWGPHTQEVCTWIDGVAWQEDADGDFEFSETARNFKIAFSDAAMERYIRIVQRNAREWRDYARRSIDTPPRVLQSENLMGWFNRARRYRSM